MYQHTTVQKLDFRGVGQRTNRCMVCPFLLGKQPYCLFGLSDKTHKKNKQFKIIQAHIWFEILPSSCLIDLTDIAKVPELYSSRSKILMGRLMVSIPGARNLSVCLHV